MRDILLQRDAKSWAFVCGDTFIGPDGNEYPGQEFDHKIYFEWFKGGKHENRVRIYITPTPPGFNTNPPKPPAPPPPES